MHFLRSHPTQNLGHFLKEPNPRESIFSLRHRNLLVNSKLRAIPSFRAFPISVGM